MEFGSSDQQGGARPESKPEKDYTLVFCVKRENGDFDPNDLDYSKNSLVMMGMKKRGFGVGKWNGFGGKVEAGESNEQAAIRELEEESSVVAKELARVGFLKFVMQDKLMNVHVYMCYQFEGEGVESDEMRPKWFKSAELDYDTMWPDDRFWVPIVLQGKRFLGRFEYDDDDETILDHQVSIQ